MYIVKANEKIHGLVSSGASPVLSDVKFFSGYGVCKTQYQKKVHCDLGFEFVDSSDFRSLRSKRVLSSVVLRSLGGIGDSMWSMPIAKAIKSKFPQCAIAVATESKNKSAWLCCPHVNSVLDLGSWQHFELERRADEVYDFGGIATMYPELAKLEPVEACFRVAELDLPADKGDMLPDLRIKLSTGQNAAEFLKSHGIILGHKPFVVLAYEASTPNRWWPYDYTAELAGRLADNGYSVALIGSSSSDLFTKHSQFFKEKCICNFSGKTSLEESWAIMSLANCVLAMNSSPMVAATALRIPTVAIFGTHDPRRLAKYYDKFIACQSDLKCIPCNDHWTECQHGHPAPCMKSVSVYHVYTQILKCIKLYPRDYASFKPID